MVLIMATSPQITLDFNRQIKLANNEGFLSSDTGKFLFREFNEKNWLLSNTGTS